MAIMQSDTESLWRLNPKCHSSWKRLIRICAWVIRFITNARRLVNSKMNGELLPSEVKDAEDWLIRSTQEESFAEEYKLLKTGKSISNSSKLICLQPIMDDYGIMRCNSRIVNAEFLPVETRYPVILPRTSGVTKLIIKQCHEDGYIALVQTIHLQLYQQSIGSYQQEKPSEKLKKIVLYVEEEKQS